VGFCRRESEEQKGKEGPGSYRGHFVLLTVISLCLQFPPRWRGPFSHRRNLFLRRSSASLRLNPVLNSPTTADNEPSRRQKRRKFHQSSRTCNVVLFESHVRKTPEIRSFALEKTAGEGEYPSNRVENCCRGGQMAGGRAGRGERTTQRSQRRTV